jgi:hypothetical protein
VERELIVSEIELHQPELSVSELQQRLRQRRAAAAEYMGGHISRQDYEAVEERNRPDYTSMLYSVTNTREAHSPTDGANSDE